MVKGTDTLFYVADCIKLLAALDSESTSEPLNIQQVIAYVAHVIKNG